MKGFIIIEGGWALQSLPLFQLLRGLREEDGSSASRAVAPCVTCIATPGRSCWDCPGICSSQHGVMQGDLAPGSYPGRQVLLCIDLIFRRGEMVETRARSRKAKQTFDPSPTSPRVV